ncbi:hypothetical protein MGN70_011493 [Eutypa lata]|nr:hypothetical protein MGN70_011493 [Eutypa lata]
MAGLPSSHQGQQQPPEEASTPTATWPADAAVLTASDPQEPDEEEEDDDGISDADSALGNDTASTTASLSASIMDYRTVHGRTYHSEKHATRYWGPNDDRQNDAIDINHHVLTLLLDGKLHLAPLRKDIQKVLDIGTGTGIWAIDFADEYPGAQVLGTDLSPIQPYWVPPNCKFEIDDAELPWTWPADTFDFVHVRYLVGAISDWPQFFKQAYATLKPGGWIETFEPDAAFKSDDGTLPLDSHLVRWTTMNHEGGRRIGKPFTIVGDDLQVKGLQEAGFTDITVKNLKVRAYCIGCSRNPAPNFRR